ncbi:MAG: DUF6502 family protein [Burkholderiaceae bacterium]
MTSSSEPPSALERAIEQLLRPLFRLLLRHSVSLGAFEGIAKRVYVDVALKDFAIPGKKVSASRVAVVSGLTRKEVHRLMMEPKGPVGEGAERYNRAARVLTGWVRDADFGGPDGAPRALDVEGEQGFAELVRRYSGDMPARAVLDELLRVGAVEQHEDARLRLVTRAYVPQHSQTDKLGILGSDVADLIDTIDHNLQHGAADPRFQRKVMYQSVPVEALPAFRKLGAANSQALLEKLDRWLAAHDAAAPSDRPEPPRARVGVGIYYFEERLEPSAPTENTP